jgi:hypothetical protein
MGYKHYFQGMQHDGGVIDLIITDLPKGLHVLGLFVPSHEILHVGTWLTSLSWIACSLLSHLSYMMMVHCLFSICMIQKFSNKSMHTLWPTTPKFSKNELFVIIC